MFATADVGFFSPSATTSSGSCWRGVGHATTRHDPLRQNGDRVSRAAELDAILEPLLKEQPTSHWVDLVAATRRPAPRCRQQGVLDDPQVEAMGMAPVEHTHRADARSRRADRVELAGAISARRGEHTAEVLGELGCNETASRSWRATV
jgi:crotonobetainyl-CoA:carnitine CoA-transferase CaiB-like acyl-CoA transferase